MTYIDALIIDDEPKLTEVLKLKIEQHCPDIKVLGSAQNIVEAKEKIELWNPKLIFLDITMPGGSGFQLLDQIENINFEIIFVTGYSEYALDALKVSAAEYLLKPVKTNELIEAVEKVKVKINQKEEAKRYQLLKHNIENVGKQDSKIVIPGQKSYEIVNIRDIIRCEGVQKYTYIYMMNGQKFLSSYNVGVYKDMLTNYNFYSVHKSHIINNNHIKRYLTEGTIIMIDDSTVPVSRRKKDEFTSKILGI
ncbi:MAG TPA: LytTR family DNA-binding domain-containing protein [Saprospiraceae bacterium]|nr:LytTR family DNA-binding domain-containing protein [Saprospiraceae bacterium]